MNPRVAERFIRELVMNHPERVFLTAHAKRRDPSAGKHPLTVSQIHACLLKGTVTEPPAPDLKMSEGWKVRVTRNRAGELHEVAAVLVPETRILVITAYAWD